MLDWWLMPLSGALQHSIEPWAYWHARAMVLGWGVLLPLGALVARYFKVTRRQRWPEQLDNKAWWHAHLGLQWGGMAAVSVGALLVWDHGTGSSNAARWHAWGGWALVLMGWLQIAAGLARGSKGGPTSDALRGDHYDMTPHRVRFERLHKGVGWLSVVAAVVVMVLGLQVADAPRWMAGVLAAWWALLTLAAWRWQRQGRCLDTYQAIWGPDPRHPGNRVRPIGWGVRRTQS
jgi:Eukaryotic cytochrome b561